MKMFIVPLCGTEECLEEAYCAVNVRVMYKDQANKQVAQTVYTCKNHLQELRNSASKRMREYQNLRIVLDVKPLNNMVC